jgi:hypothetical protein
VKTIAGISRLNENRIRDEFVVDLQKNSQLISHALDYKIIKIVPENWDAVKRRRCDIVFFIAALGELWFECKKLNRPADVYLHEGLMRFIQLDYAPNEARVGMIGFVLKPNIPDGLKKKIQRCCMIDFIDEPILGHPASYRSVHLRANRTALFVNHLFFHFSVVKVNLFPDTFRKSSWQSVSSSGRMFLAKETSLKGGTHDCRNKDSTGEDDITTTGGEAEERL